MVKKVLGMIIAVVLTAVAWTCAPVLAAGYPDKPITLVVPYGPGGSTDLVARALSQKMSDSMGQPIIVENRSGNGGMIGSEFVARAAPDGYTIVVGTGATHGLVKFTSKVLGYDPAKDFTALTEAVEVPTALAVHISVPAKNAKEFVEYVKKRPGKISFGSSGAGSTMYFAGALLNQMSGIDMVHVPYRGAGQAMQDLVGGQIPAIFTSLSTAIPQASGGKIKILGLAEAKRQASMPELPTIGESIPGYAMPSNWIGIFGPAGMPAPIVKRLNAELLKALRAPDTRARLEAAGLSVIGTSAEEFATVVKDHIEMYRKITTASGFKPE